MVVGVWCSTLLRTLSSGMNQQRLLIAGVDRVADDDLGCDSSVMRLSNNLKGRCDVWLSSDGVTGLISL
jgi:hypothetical protein